MVPNLFLFPYTLTGKRNLTYPLARWQRVFYGVFINKRKLLANPLRFLTYPCGYAYPRLGTTDLNHFPSLGTWNLLFHGNLTKHWANHKTKQESRLILVVAMLLIGFQEKKWNHICSSLKLLLTNWYSFWSFNFFCLDGEKLK